MALNFPDSPSVNDTYTVGSTTWTWDGTVWNSSTGAIIPTYVSSFNGATGNVEGVSSVNGVTGAIKLKPDVAVAPLSGTHLSATHNLATSAQTAVAMTVNKATALPLVLGFDTEISAANINVTTAAAGADFQLALYESGADGYPTSTPTYTSATLSGATTGVKTDTFGSNITLYAGKQYWLAVNCGATACTVRAVSSGTQRVLRSVGNASNQLGLLSWSQSGFSWRDFSSSPVVSSDIVNAHGPMLYFTVA